MQFDFLYILLLFNFCLIIFFVCVFSKKYPSYNKDIKKMQIMFYFQLRRDLFVDLIWKE